MIASEKLVADEADKASETKVVTTSIDGAVVEVDAVIEDIELERRSGIQAIRADIRTLSLMDCWAR